MELFFNDLSLNKKTNIQYNEILELRNIFEALKHYDFNHCRMDDSSYEKLFNMILNMPNNSNFKNFFFSFFQRPYEDKEVLAHEDDYYLYEWKYDGQGCIGLVLSFIMESACLSLVDDKWDSPYVYILRNSEQVSVRNIGRMEHVQFHKEWLEGLKNVVLIESDSLPEDKSIVLRDDHGKNVLMKYCKRILNSPYVIEIVNSLPFAPKEHKYIKAIREDGLIEIVLNWTDQGLGFVVKTTGRNKRETETIAKILEQEYGFL